jgi:phosphoadenosine phosphosulfate reductase
MESSIEALLTGNRPIEERSVELEALDEAEVIAAALRMFGTDALVSTAFGPTGLCLLDLAQRADPDVRAYYIDTQFSFPETTRLADRWVEERKLRLERVLPMLNPEAQAARYGEALWSRDPDLCCHMRKVEPNNQKLTEARIWLTALRRDQSASRAQTPILEEVILTNGHRLLKLCPLVNWTRQDVWRYVFDRKLPYNPLHDQGYPSVGCTHCTHAVGDTSDERAGRWVGLARTECGLHVNKPE